MAFDVIVIGGGPPGIDVAVLCQTAGLKTALAERELVGGECHYWGCIPSKTLLRPNEVLAHARRVPGAREVLSAGVDAPSALARHDANADHWDDTPARALVEDAGVTIVSGHARLVGERAVEVEGSDGDVQRLSAARAVVLAPGSAAAFPPVDGLLDAAPWDNRRGPTALKCPVGCSFSAAAPWASSSPRRGSPCSTQPPRQRVPSIVRAAARCAWPLGRGGIAQRRALRHCKRSASARTQPRKRAVMTIEAQQLQTWIGTEVLDSSGEKLGKLDNIFFRDTEPLAVSIRSGLGGRKHHAAALRGATVSRDSLHLDVAAEAVIAIGAEGIGAEQLTKLAAQDDRLQGIEANYLEGWHARAERLKAQAEAQAEADKLEAEAQRRAADEDAAASKARDADHEAEEARRAREDAEARALKARQDAERPV